MKQLLKSDQSAVDIARAHIEAWSNHDYQTARKYLADDVHVTVTTTQPLMAPTDTIGADRYMEGLVKFAELVNKGSAHITESIGDAQNALVTVIVRARLGPDKRAMILPAARLYLLDETRKIKAEQVIFYAAPDPEPETEM